jgi:hypothetical protein
VSGDARREAGKQYDGEETTIVKRQAARTTYIEHILHVRHRAHVPIADGLIEVIGILHRRDGRAAVWRERRSRGGGTGDGR